MDSTAHLTVRVVSADAMVWEGEAERVVARTTEGDIGILPNHEPLLAALVPCVVEVVSVEGTTELLAIDGGFISVESNNVDVLSQFAQLSQEINIKQAESDLAHAESALEAGDTSEENMHLLRRSQAQLAAAEHAGKR